MHALLIAAMILIPPCAFGAGVPVIGGKKHLFLDDSLIGSADGVRRVIHPARKHPGNPVIAETEPWEAGAISLFGSVLREGGRFRLWYLCGGKLCYAESRDGLDWIRPALDIVQIDGRKTNILLQGSREGTAQPGILPYFREVFGVFRDTRDADASRRFKMGFLSIQENYSGPREDPFHKGQRRGMGVAASPDGLHWRLLNNWATEITCDGGTHWMFDEARKKYVLYGRTKSIAPELDRAWGLTGIPELPIEPATHAWFKRRHWGRAVARTESEDFLNWDLKDPGQAPVVLTADVYDPPGSEVYDLMAFPYGAAYVGLVKVYRRLPNREEVLDIELAASTDGIHFTRVGDRTPFIPVGPVGEWDRFNHSLPTNAPLEVGDELRFYYGGRSRRHSRYDGKDTGQITGIGLATLPRDRFASLAASFDGGTVITRPVRLEGGVIHLNAKASFGEIRVALLDSSGNVLAASAPVRQDSLDVPVAWETGRTVTGMPVCLRIQLVNAHLFAVWCQ